MKKYGVVRSLWGDMLCRREKTQVPDFYFRMLHQVRDSVAGQEQSDLVCCWGIENYKYCKYLGLKNLVLMDTNPYMFHGEDTRNMSYNGMIQWRHNYFIHKWYSALKGLECFTAIMTVDWDYRQKQSVSMDWWERQCGYQVPFRASLFQTKTPRMGAYWRRTEPDVLPHCGCVWYGSADFVAGCRGLNEEFPRFLQQQCIAKWFDEIQGGWIGANKYWRLGYEADFIRFKGRRFPHRRDKIIWSTL